MAYFGNKRGEIRELQNSLMDPRVETKMQAIRQIIAAMTVGKDVSMLFMDVLKNMETSNIELKKLVYLYVMNYAKTHPDLAILGINTFRKDAKEKFNPLLRALAIRTMGCIRIKQVVEYLVDPLREALKDEDSYVRKTAALCVAKMHELDPQLMEEQGFIKMLENLLTDGNAMVVSNAVAALSSIQEGKGSVSINLTFHNVQKLLTALNECNEWGLTVIIDNLVHYVPSDGKETEDILDRVSSRLSHSNPGVVISTVRLTMKFLDYLTNPDLIRKYTKKLAAPLISLLSSSGENNEISYVALKNINLILQKRPNVLEKELKMFFCNFNDPIYTKLEKLDILVRLADMKNIDLILHELKEYANEIDVEFVRRSIRTIGRCAIKLEKASERCVQALWELLRSKVSYVVQECIIVIKDIFRKYPGKFEAILKDLCDNLKILEEPEAKASMIWIIGEYVEIIENADRILGEFFKGFKDESAIVQLQILSSYVKLYLTRPGDVESIIMELLNMCTEESENPDLRDRAFIYWRLLSKDPSIAKKIIFAEKPPISDSSYTMESQLLDKLIENIGTLASVYGKPPEQFVKKLRESQNQRELDDIEDNPEFIEDYVDSTGQKAGSYQAQIAQNEYDTALKNKEIDLLGMDEPAEKVNTNTSIDMLGNSFSTASTSSNSSNIKIPYAEVLSSQTPSLEKKVAGLQVEAAFQRDGDNAYLDLKLTNKMQKVLSDFAIKFNQNPFRLEPENPGINVSQIEPGASASTRVLVKFNGPQDSNLPECPYRVQAALKTSVDIFLIYIPCSLTVLMAPNTALSTQDYQTLCSKGYPKKQNQINTNLDSESIKKKFNNNNLMFVGSRTNNEGVELLSFSTKLANGMPCALDAIYEKNSGVLKLSYQAPHDSVLPLLYQAVGFILNM